LPKSDEVKLRIWDKMELVFQPGEFGGARKVRLRSFSRGGEARRRGALGIVDGGGAAFLSTIIHKEGIEGLQLSIRGEKMAVKSGLQKRGMIRIQGSGSTGDKKGRGKNW